MTITDPVLQSHWDRYLQVSGAQAAEVETTFQERFSGLRPGDDHIVFPPPPFSASFIDEMVEASRTILACIDAIPERVFGGNVRAWLAFQGLEDDEIDFLQQCCRGRQRAMATSFARPDYVIADGTARMVEMNIAPPLGGTDTCDRIADEVHASAFGRFLAAAGIELESPDTLGHWTRAIRALARTRPDRPAPVFFVALADPDEQPSPRYPNYVRTIEAAGFVHRRGLIQELHVRPDGVYHQGERVDVVFTMFTYAEFLRFQVPRPLALALARADEEGLVDYLLSPVNIAFDNKANLELLTSPECAAHWTLHERQVFARHIPATRRWRGARFAQAAELRASLVLKPARDFGGAGVTIGANVGDAAWRAALDAALAPGEHWVLQDVAAPMWRHEAASGTALNVCLGPLLYRGVHGGTFLRLRPAMDGGVPVINAAQGASVGLAMVRRG
jgi:hypothetical protein